MKNILKKVSVIAMAAVLLGAGGTAAANLKSANSNNLTASAANGYPASRYDGHAHGNYVFYEDKLIQTGRYEWHWYRYYYCRACGEYVNRVRL